MSRIIRTAWGSRPPHSYFDDTQSFQAGRDSIIENIYLNIPDPLVYDDDGNLFTGQVEIQENDHIDTLTYRDLRRRAREAGRRSRPPSFAAGFEPGHGYFIRIVRSQQMPMANYFLEHPEIFGSILDRQGAFSSDEFWRNTHGPWPLSVQPDEVEDTRTPTGPAYRTSVYRERIFTPQIELYDSDDESDMGLNINADDYHTISLGEVIGLLAELGVEDYEATNPISSTRHIWQRVGFEFQDDTEDSLYVDPTNWSQSFNIWGNTTPMNSYEGGLHRSSTPPPDPEDGEGNDQPHWMVEGFEADYVEGWSGDEASGDANPAAEDQANQLSWGNDIDINIDTASAIQRLSEELTQITLEAPSTGNPQSQGWEGNIDVILLEETTRPGSGSTSGNQEPPTAVRVPSVANPNDVNAVEAEQRITPDGSNPETS
ncbi:hypothetical protein TWF788_006026 [Orbilia oligospora]|uniref:Uncharacterized protein n=1 Tax=Orbilia oligospora TaxID=2813651 RepID=A0A7C8Q3J0_ORBOL|nr:hypothetical protein TWF788_006026 [Orbilia oligospora]